MNATVRKLVFSLAVIMAAASSASAQSNDAPNAVSDVSVQETDAQTVIRVAGTTNPTYSVYRLRNPLRLFVDIANSSVDGAPTTVSIENGVVNQVATVEYEDALTQVTRVVVGFDVDAWYDVTSDGNDVVITIDGAQRRSFLVEAPSSPEEMAQLRGELDSTQQRIDALEQAARDAEASRESAEAEMLRAQADRERAELERLQAIEEAAQAQGETDRFRGEVDELRAELDRRDAELARLASDREEALALIERIQEQTAESQSDVESRDIELARLRQEEEQLRAQIDQAQADGRSQDELNALLEARDRQVEQLQSRQTELEAVLAESREREAELQNALTRAREAQEQQQDLISEQRAIVEQLQQAQAEAPEAPVRVEEAQSAPTIEELAAEWQGPTGEVADVRFEHVGGVDRVVIELPPGATYATLPFEDGRAGLEIGNAVLPDRLRRTLDTQAFDGAVDYVSSYTDGEGDIRVVAELNSGASEIVRESDGSIVWEFVSAPGEEASLDATSELPTSSAPEVATYTSQTESYTLQTSFQSDSAYTSRPRMTRKRITIDLRNADIQNVLRLVADEGNINIVAGSDVSGSVTLRLRSVPLDEALVVILRSLGLGWEQEGSIIRVAPLEVFEEEYERAMQRLADSFQIEPLQVRIIPINYAEADDLSELVGAVLSARGSAAVDERNNALIVTDVTANLDAAEELVRQLDTQTPQILIEARVVETNDQFRRQVGIQWGGDFIADQSLGNATGLLFPSTVGIAGGSTDSQTPTNGTSSNPNFAVNLPAPAGTGTGGAVGFTFGSLSGAFNLNLRLSAAEDQGSAKVISAPRIMTLDNQVATITSGVSIPVSVVSAAGAQTVFFDASLTLEVTPRVTPDGNIFLEVSITKNEPDFENTGARGDPSIIRREAQTQLLVRDGDTTVIGGIFTRNSGFSTNSIPFFGTLPIIGPLFRNSSQTDVRNELLVFITPRIVNRDLSIDTIGTGGDILPPAEED